MSQKFEPPNSPPPSYAGPGQQTQAPTYISSPPQSHYGPVTPYDHPAYAQQIGPSDRGYGPPQQQQGYYGNYNNAQPYYQGQQPPGMYNQQQPQPGMYYQQQPQPYGPGYYGNNGRGGGASQGIMAGCLAALGVCCCLDFLF